MQRLVEFFMISFPLLTLRPWINQTTWLNYTLIRSCITFLIYKISFWKFGKRNKKQYSTSVNFSLVKSFKILQNLSIIKFNCKKFSKIFLNRSWQMFIIYCIFQIFRKIFCKLKKLSNIFFFLHCFVTIFYGQSGHLKKGTLVGSRFKHFY